MMQGRSLLTVLFLILIVTTFGGLLWIQHLYYKNELLDKDQIISAQNQDIDGFKHQLSTHDVKQTETKAQLDDRLQQYALQIETLTADYRDLKKSYQEDRAALAECNQALAVLKSAPPAESLAEPSEQTLSTAISSGADNTQAMDAASTTATVPEAAPVPEPAATDIPTQAAPDTSTVTLESTTETLHTQTKFACPSGEEVNQHLDTGHWSDPNFKWWLEFSFRPLRDDEHVKKPFQVLYTGNSIDCYYRIGPKSSDEEISNTWVVIKGTTQQPFQLNGDWEPCNMEGCEKKCEYHNGTGCNFDLLEKRD